ncbi:class I SAM-dependent methyltransferase [Pelagibacteraceae bacterium]|nr:class I SAM-dependent methyltransferase [Pelagibacteraceae bacterium]
MLFLKEYKSKKIKNENLNKSRKKVFNSKNPNLEFLLYKRFSWMKNYIKNKEHIIELGSGNGCIKKIINSKKIILTDIIKHKWINKKIDMRKINLGKKYYNKIDVFIFNHSLHHCSNPSKTLKLISRYLKKGGHILLNEPETSFSLRLIQYILDDEGWSFKVDIFNTKKDIFISDDPWFSNTATANLLFSNPNKFHKNFPSYQIIKNELSEFLIFINSSGVNQNIFYIRSNKFLNSILSFIDKILIFMFPKIFALNRSVVIKKFK